MKKLLLFFKEAWSKETCVPSVRENWSKENSSIGQCAITALVINDIYGGKIMRCMCAGGSHYYNYIDEKIVDLTVDQFDNIIPDYKNSAERTREYLLSNDDTKSRYLILLKKIHDIISDYSFEKINIDDRIDKKYFNDNFGISTFEIDYYFETKEKEIVQFDLAAQNTGSIFKYAYLKNQDKYELIDSAIFSCKKDFTTIPKEILEQIFIVARDNKEELKQLEKTKTR